MAVGYSGETSFAAAFTGAELAQALDLVELSGQSDNFGGGAAASISTDTRTVKPGQWYLALKGETFDGHRFVDAAIKAGAAGVIMSSSPNSTEIPSSVTIFRVNDTLAAYHQIARYWLARVNPFIIGVTGSSGKTTTKEMCAAVVSSKRFHKSAANENNEFGLPKTILSMPADTAVLVAEMAMRGLDQIALLARTATPDAGIITGVGTAHIELLGSVDKIIQAKCEMFEQMRDRGLGIIGNPTQPLVAQARKVFSGELALFVESDLREVQVSLEHTRFTVRGFDGEFVLHAHGIRHLQDAWCAMIAARAAGVSDGEIRAGLQLWKSVEGRGNRLAMSNGAVVVDESYNANPDSVRCAVEALLDKRAFPQSNKYVVLGEMAELGESTELLHKQTGEWIKGTGISMLITVGDKARKIADAAAGGAFAVFPCEDQAEALDILKPQLSTDSCVMVKGSHCANLDKLVAHLVAK